MWEALFAFHICIARSELLGCQVAQCAVWAHLVVVDSPAFDGLPSVFQSEKPVFVEALLAQLAVDGALEEVLLTGGVLNRRLLGSEGVE